MKLICGSCGRDLNQIGQDNMSPSLDYVLCEDCSGLLQEDVESAYEKYVSEQLEKEYVAYCEQQEREYLMKLEENRKSEAKAMLEDSSEVAHGVNTPSAIWLTEDEMLLLAELSGISGDCRHDEENLREFLGKPLAITPQLLDRILAKRSRKKLTKVLIENSEIWENVGIPLDQALTLDYLNAFKNQSKARENLRGDFSMDYKEKCKLLDENYKKFCTIATEVNAINISGLSTEEIRATSDLLATLTMQLRETKYNSEGVPVSIKPPHGFAITPNDIEKLSPEEIEEDARMLSSMLEQINEFKNQSKARENLRGDFSMDGIEKGLKAISDSIDARGKRVIQAEEVLLRVLSRENKPILTSDLWRKMGAEGVSHSLARDVTGRLNDAGRIAIDYNTYLCWIPAPSETTPTPPGQW